MEFHEKFNGIKFYGIPLNFSWNSMEKYNEKIPSNVYEKFHGISWKISWNSMEFNEIPWNPMEFFMEMSMDGKFHELTERFSPGVYNQKYFRWLHLIST
jgi:hypothetical protein